MKIIKEFNNINKRTWIAYNNASNWKSNIVIGIKGDNNVTNGD